MRRLVRPFSFALCCAAMAVIHIPRSALADEAGSSPPGAEAREAAQPREAVDPREVKEARAEVDATNAQMRAVALRVREHLRATRKRGTRMQITCVDEALSRADVAARRARDTGDDMLAAYLRGDLEIARRARQRIEELREAARVAARDGAACSASFVQIARVSGTTVKVDVDPRIARTP